MIEASEPAICCASLITLAMASSRYTRSRESLATAASTAAISSGSGGSGMYSLAPAWMAATAARGLLSMPQATIGTWMCSASSFCTSSRMSIATSTMSMSAPRPERSTASAWVMCSAWVTVAPLSIAILVAVVSWPLSVPTIRRRMVLLLFQFAHDLVRKPVPVFRDRALIIFRFDDFGHRHAELVFDENDFAAGHQAVVDVDVDRLADLTVEFKHGAGSDLEQVADLHARTAENGRDLHRNVVDGFEVGGRAIDMAFAAGRNLNDVGRRQRGACLHFEIGEWHLAVIVTHIRSPEAQF